MRINPIECISFAYRVGEAVCVPWLDEYKPQVLRLMTLPWSDPDDLWNRDRGLLWWNGWGFDEPRLMLEPEFGRWRDELLFFCGNLNLDLMECFHFLESDLRKGLKFAAPYLLYEAQEWASKSSERPEFYSCVDSDYLLRCGLEIRRRLIKEGRWQDF